MKPKLVVFFVVCLLLSFGIEAQARGHFFGKRRQKRAVAQKQFDHVGERSFTENGGKLRVNKRGGFEGQLTDADFAEYFAAKEKSIVVKVNAEPEVAVSQQFEAEPSPVDTLAEAKANVETLAAQLDAARAAVDKALLENKREAEREASEIEFLIQQLKANTKNQIDDLKARRAKLLPSKG